MKGQKLFVVGPKVISLGNNLIIARVGKLQEIQVNNFIVLE